jgi:hypothetical protein
MDGNETRGKLPQKKVFSITEREPREGEDKGKSIFTAIGAGWVNHDGSLTCLLDALPAHSKLYIRDFDVSRDTAKGRADAGWARRGPRRRCWRWRARSASGRWRRGR